MSDNPTSRSSRENQPKDKEHTFVGPASEYVECVERLKAIFPDENDKGALIAAIEGCVEIMVNPRASDAAGDIDFPPPPPLAQRSGTGAVPRKKNETDIYPAADVLDVAANLRPHLPSVGGTWQTSIGTAL